MTNSFGQDLNKLVKLTQDYMNVGGYLTASEWGYQAREEIIQKYGKDSERYFYIQERLGVINTHLANYTEAERCFNEVILWHKTNNTETTLAYAKIMNGTAKLYQKMGLFKKAEKDYLQALQIKQKEPAKNAKSIATTYNNLGTLYNNLKDYEKAEAYYLKSLALKKEASGKTISYAYTLNNLARIYEKTDRDSIAAEYYKEALYIKKELVGEEHLSYARTLANVAFLLHKQGNHKKAEEYYLSAHRVMKWKLGEDHPEYNDLLYNIGEFLNECNRPFEAKYYYELMLTNAFKQIKEYFPSLTESEKNKFYNSLKDRMETYDAFALKMYQNKAVRDRQKYLVQMYDNQLATKAILLNETGKVKNKILASGNEQLIQLYDKWKLKKDEYASIMSIAKKDRVNLQANKAQLEIEIQQLEKQLVLQSSAFKHSEDATTYTSKSVLRHLKIGEAAIEIIRFNDHDQEGVVHYLALILAKKSRGAYQLVSLPDGNKMESNYLTYYQNAITHQVRDEKSYQRYWAPIQKKLKGVKKVYVSPDGVYNQLNLNTFYNTDSSRYLLNDLNIHMVTKTSDIIEFEHKDIFASQKTHTAVLFGRPDFFIDTTINTIETSTLNEEYAVVAGQKRYASLVKSAVFPDLPATEKEVAEIAELINSGRDKNLWKSETYMGDKATEKALKAIKNPTLLHIATHGFFIGEKNDSTEKFDKGASDHAVNPMLRSGLILAGVSNYYQANDVPEGDDGILTAMEATNLELDSTQLVVLSACETGLGEIKKGEGVYGMFRALKIAGAKTILMSHWQVDDQATQELMFTFYKKWLETGNKHEAFKFAQNKIKLKYQHPYYWGAFVMVGE